MILTSKFFIFILFGLVCLASTENSDCKNQQTVISNRLLDTSTKQKFLSEFVFKNDSKQGLQITWAGQNSKTLIAVTLASYTSKATVADVYRSTNDGRTFSRITDKISPDQQLLLLTQFGLQRNPRNSSWLYLACSGSTDATTNLYLSLDNGASWQRSVLSFVLSQEFIYHETRPELALGLSGDRLFVTRDGGISWTHLKDHVVKASWGSTTDQANAIYIVQDDSTDSSSDTKPSIIRDATRLPRASRSLLKTIDFGDSWKTLMKNIYSYVGRENFLFVSLGEPDGILRRLEVSTDYGQSFHRTSLPRIRPDNFASLLDVNNGLAFVYVDSGGLNGYGALYTSDASGRLFAKSLERQFYPPGRLANDFYRIESMPGSYLSTVMKPDHSLRTMITHNRGAVWESLNASTNCTIGSCQLQLVSAYDIAGGQPAQQPVSIATAPGLLVAHGNVGNSIQTYLNSDVYLSSDGGYSWSKVLNGSHLVQLGNNGGFIAAVPYGSEGPREIQYSTDAGRCWHEYKFTDEDYSLTGFVSEPGNRATSVAIWGYSKFNRHWRVFVIDFAAILTRECGDSDYEDWLVNGEIRQQSGDKVTSGERACLFGVKQTIKRLKPDSLCTNSYNYSPSKTVQPCNCTADDFGCEFGYTREYNSRKCVRDPTVENLDICVDEISVQRIITDGYRKLPGNQCVGGFSPNKTEQTALKGYRCSQLLQRQQERAEAKLKAQAEAAKRLAAQLAASKAGDAANQRNRMLSILLPVTAILGGLVLAVLALVLAAKLRERRRRLVAFRYSVVSATGRQEDIESSSSSAGGANAAATASGSSTLSTRRRAEDKQLLVADDDADEANGEAAESVKA